MAIVNGYCTEAMLQAELQSGASTWESSDTAVMERAIAAASRQIDGWCGRRFWQDGTVVARYYQPDSPICCYVDDISTTTGLIVAVDTALDGTYSDVLTVNTHFFLEPVNAAVQVPAWPYTELTVTPYTGSYYFPRSQRSTVKVTAKFGWPAVPDDVTKACLVLSADLYKAKDVAFGVAGATEFGPLRVQSGMNRTAAVLLAPYRKGSVG